MQDTAAIIKQLLAEQRENLDDGVFRISIYVPNKKVRKDILTSLRSAITQEFKKHPDLKDIGVEKRVMVEEVLKEIGKIEDLQGGVGIFSSFRVEDLRRGGKNGLGFLRVVVLPWEVEEEASVGKSFDLDQLVWENQVRVNALVGELNEEGMRLFLLVGRDLKLVKEWENKYIPEQENEYLNKFSPLRGSGIYHGTGEENFERRLREGRKRFLNEVLEELKGQRVDGGKMLWFFSDGYKDLVNGEKKNEKWVNKAMVKDGELETAAVAMLRDWIEEEERREWLTAKEERGLIYGWKEVAAAAREGRIEELFMRPKAKQSGYLSNEEWPFTENTQGARVTRNIGPWIVLLVVETGGKVFRLTDGEEEIAAKLRY